MRQETFEKKNQDIWNQFNLIIEEIDKKKSKRDKKVNIKDLPFLYRKICNHYAIALSRQYSPVLVSGLHNMVLEGHKRLYKKNTFFISSIIEFIIFTFPQSFRKNIIYFIIALSLFLAPAISTGVSCYLKKDLIYSLMNDHQVSEFEFMYDPANKKTGRTLKRSSDTDVMMFGHYIKNNISIGFRTFAGGILAGLGTLFFLIYNGIILGGVSGHITGIGFGETFWPFVSGHGAFELTAIVISGAAGLILAEKIIAPGNYKRGDALKIAGPRAFNLIMGAFIMLIIAALIEAFWSSSGLDKSIKYVFAGFFWLMVILYLSFSGKVKSN